MKEKRREPLRQRHTYTWMRNLKQASKALGITSTALVQEAVYQYIERRWDEIKAGIKK